MRYYYEKPEVYIPYGITYECNHPLYNRCTLYLEGKCGLAVIQERFDLERKHRYWSEIDPWLSFDVYLSPRFHTKFKEYAKEAKDNLYPTITVRKLMWQLRMKPLKKEFWEETQNKQVLDTI